MCTREVDRGSIVFAERHGVKTIMRVGKVLRGKFVICHDDQAITDFGAGFIKTSVIVKDYGGELLENVTLVGGDEFDIFCSFFPLK